MFVCLDTTLYLINILPATLLTLLYISTDSVNNEHRCVCRTKIVPSVEVHHVEVLTVIVPVVFSGSCL